MTSEESTPVEPHDAYAAFRIPSFRHYLTGNFVFLVGLQMQKVALGWEIYERTGSALHLGYVGLAQFAPQLVLAPFGGHVVDAYNRKKVLFAALTVSLLCSLGLAAGFADAGAALGVLRAAGGHRRRPQLLDAGAQRDPAADRAGAAVPQRRVVELQPASSWRASAVRRSAACSSACSTAATRSTCSTSPPP